MQVVPIGTRNSNPSAVHPVASRYTDCATAAHTAMYVQVYSQECVPYDTDVSLLLILLKGLTYFIVNTLVLHSATGRF
jgi:hypothetical protein